jgi:hypothetical protein
MSDSAARPLEWTDWRFWKNGIEVDHEVLRAFLNSALVVDAAVEVDDESGVTHVLLELHHEGEPNRMMRLSAHGVHTEGWIVPEVLP